ncbi:uncharacterized protein K452DRAFT_81152 [Aplosporella prunicola CBS 121167]|uniref:Uncharacterized protein n=1 Tax=Aplosporella prunicola CBS 121167 TaxID=1176127 RepID=A0A6A6B4I7_9PEZI|nr:uncharacterized protein K452DRAFT_81152 [Aplosporella prunicola CBS 121167]KAF2139119.1 hypothetical protein K452DRAFT_81152 [Aplosporella prunicola CBS 121167]
MAVSQIGKRPDVAPTTALPERADADQRAAQPVRVGPQDAPSHLAARAHGRASVHVYRLLANRGGRAQREGKKRAILGSSVPEVAHESSRVEARESGRGAAHPHVRARPPWLSQTLLLEGAAPAVPDGNDPRCRRHGSPRARASRRAVLGGRGLRTGGRARVRGLAGSACELRQRGEARRVTSRLVAAGQQHAAASLSTSS